MADVPEVSIMVAKEWYSGGCIFVAMMKTRMQKKKKKREGHNRSCLEVDRSLIVVHGV